MPISSGPLTLSRSVGAPPLTWNAPGLHTHPELSSGSHSNVTRPPGSCADRHLDIAFGHAQLIPTFTLTPEEAYTQPPSEYLPASHAPAPRRTAVAEGDTSVQLGMTPARPISHAWSNSVIRPTESSLPMGGGNSNTMTNRSAMKARTHSQSPLRGPLYTSPSSTAFSSSAAPLRDQSKARAYVDALDRELTSQARQAAKETRGMTRAASAGTTSAAAAASLPSSRGRRSQHVPHNEMLLGMHVRSMEFEKRWINSRQNAALNSHQSVLNRTQEIRSPSSSVYNRARERPHESGLPDKSVDLGFYASGIRVKEEGRGGKALIKTREFPRDPAVGVVLEEQSRSTAAAAAADGGLNESFGRHQFASSTLGSSSRKKYAPAKIKEPLLQQQQHQQKPAQTLTPQPTHNRPTSARNASPLPYSMIAPSSESKQQYHQQQQQQQQQQTQRPQSALPPSRSPSAMHTFSVSGNAHSSTMNHSISRASADSQARHAMKYVELDGSMIHPRHAADAFLRENGINVSAKSLSAKKAPQQRPASTAPTIPIASPARIEGNGAILDLAPALRARQKAPWKVGASGPKRGEKKLKGEVEIGMEEGVKKKLPSSHRTVAAAAAMRPTSAKTNTQDHHRTGHLVGDESRPGFLLGPTSFTPSLRLSSGHSLLGRTRVTKRIDMKEEDWEYVKGKEKAKRKRLYEASLRGPSDPRPHHTSIIEEAQILERGAVKERAIVQKEREWRQTQVWLHERKQHLAAINAKRAQTRVLPNRPRRMSTKRHEDTSSIPSNRLHTNLLVPKYMEGMSRVNHDIDLETKVRRMPNHPSHSQHQQRYQQQLWMDDDEAQMVDTLNDRRYDGDDSEIEDALFQRVRSQIPHRDPAGDATAASSASRVTDSLKHAAAARARAQEIERETHITAEEHEIDAMQRQVEYEAEQRRNDTIRIGTRVPQLTFTSSPTKGQPQHENQQQLHSQQQQSSIGLQSIDLARSYERYVSEALAQLRISQPYLREEDRLRLAQSHAREMIQQELKRMEPPSIAATPADLPHRYDHNRVEGYKDWTREELAIRQTRNEEANAEEQKYVSTTPHPLQATQARYDRMQHQTTESLRI